MRDLFFTNKADETEGENKESRPDDPNKEKNAKSFTLRSKHIERRVKSELVLNEIIPWHFFEGESYHVFSFGDVDALSYLRVIVKQQRVEYVLLSTWCMSLADVKEIRDWVEKGYIKFIDFYVGEIFRSSYTDVYLELSKLSAQFGGRVCIFRNHAKIICGFGEKFDFVVETSANVNTNPRSEFASITIDEQLARFYKEEIFDNIKSFNSDFDNWKPYKLKRDEII